MERPGPSAVRVCGVSGARCSTVLGGHFAGCGARFGGRSGLWDLLGSGEAIVLVFKLHFFEFELLFFQDLRFLFEFERRSGVVLRNEANSVFFPFGS